MVKEPEISVVMSIYNEPEEYIKQSIESILNQTFKNFEFIILLDNPNNKIAEKLIRSYLKVDKRILFIKNKKNLGLTKSLNKAIKFSKGKFIARMDADDISHPDRLREQLLFLIENKEYALCGTKAYFIDNNGNIIENINSNVDNEITNYKDILKHIVKYNPFIHSSIMFRKDIIFKVGMYNEKFKLCQDYDFLLRVCKHYKTFIIPKKLLYYRINTKGLSYSKQKESLKYTLKAKYNAVFKYGYPKKYIVFLLYSLFSYLVPLKIKQTIKRLFI